MPRSARDEARQGDTIRVVDVAVKPDHHLFPKRTLMLLGSIVLGLIIGIVWAFAAEGARRLSHNPEERARLQELRQALSCRKDRTQQCQRESSVQPR